MKTNSQEYNMHKSKKFGLNVNTPSKPPVLPKKTDKNEEKIIHFLVICIIINTGYFIISAYSDLCVTHSFDRESIHPYIKPLLIHAALFSTMWFRVSSLHWAVNLLLLPFVIGVAFFALSIPAMVIFYGMVAVCLG